MDAFEGYTVLKAYSGSEYCLKWKDHFQPILLDIMMPEINGYDVCQKINVMKSFSSASTILHFYDIIARRLS
jgi:CheY-like chemotaxis protein